MPKLKTHSGAAKRFKKTGTGKIKRGHAFKRHILTSKGTKRKRQLDRDTILDKADQKKIERMIPVLESGIRRMVRHPASATRP